MNRQRVNYLIHNPTEEISDSEIIAIYRGRCVDCRKPTVTIHEINPKSLVPYSWRKWINRVPLCAICHDIAHSRGTISSRDHLIALRNRRLGEYWNIWLLE